MFNKRGYGPVMDVRFNETGSGAVTVDRAEEAIDEYLDDVELERTIKFDSEEPYYVPTRGENQR